MYVDFIQFNKKSFENQEKVHEEKLLFQLDLDYHSEFILKLGQDLDTALTASISCPWSVIAGYFLNPHSVNSCLGFTLFWLLYHIIQACWEDS